MLKEGLFYIMLEKCAQNFSRILEETFSSHVIITYSKMLEGEMIQEMTDHKCTIKMCLNNHYFRVNVFLNRQ